jgi:NOL1/NOP2/fmu family ribosome biogenesis protein
LKLGEIKNGRFEPAHALAMASKRMNVKNVVNLPLDRGQVQVYLRGDTFSWEGENGWCLVCVDGYPLGWGKRVSGVVKNHYPKGLRIQH